MPPKQHTITFWVSEILHLLVGSVFLASGMTKGANLSGFVFLLERFELFAPWHVWPMAVALCAGELVLGSMLVSGYFRAAARVLTASLLTVFVIFLIVGMLGGWAHECSCYGTAVVLKPHWTVIQDGVLVLVLTVLHRSSRTTRPKPYASMRFGLVLGAAVLVALMASRSPFLDRFLVRLRPGLDMPNLPSIAREAGNLGRTRLAVVTDDMPSAAQLSALASAFPDHELVVLTTDDPPPAPLPSVTVIRGKASILPLYVHHLPTAFTVVNGVVQRVWYGRLPISPSEEH